jgi:hypothetical protein
MKKSKIDPDDLLIKMDNVFKILSKMENLENIDMDILKEEADKLKKEIEEKYSDHLDPEE